MASKRKQEAPAAGASKPNKASVASKQVKATKGKSSRPLSRSVGVKKPVHASKKPGAGKAAKLAKGGAAPVKGAKDSKCEGHSTWHGVNMSYVHL